jgi:D-alanyl-lipoteichoic acid acyltransferase DltB (MBOAT superfamily)
MLFLPIVFLLYWFVFKRLRWQNLFLVLASYVFYGWWNKSFLLLIAFTTLCSYLSGIGIEYVRSVNKTKTGGVKLDKLISVANIVLNLAILGVYKYFNFFSESLAEACSAIGIHLDSITLHLVLPVGISFYTFQALSYTIDVYKRKIEPAHDIIVFFAFISFFPQLVAGPIERATNLLPQFYRARTFEYDKAVDGCRQMLWGFFKKMVVADNCATVVNVIWSDYQQASGFKLLLGGILFTFQIYGDFSGYSDIAIGTARLFGFNLMRNFRFPYFSRDIAEFWRRWHISLTTWFRDYIYIPLGGSRCAQWKVMRNTLIIFLVSGFWHGANWTFIVWGAYHAILFFPLMLFGLNRKYTGEVAEGKLLPSVKEFFQMLLTFALVVIGWIIFRAENISQAWDYLSRMCSSSLFSVELHEGRKSLLFVLIMLVIEWLQRSKEHGLQNIDVEVLKFRPIRVIFYFLFIWIILLFLGTQETFIYFQF